MGGRRRLFTEEDFSLQMAESFQSEKSKGRDDERGRPNAVPEEKVFPLKLFFCALGTVPLVCLVIE